jgi:hypothetical protein
MNLYKELLERFYEVKGHDIKSFTKDKDLESLLNQLSICGEIKEKYEIDLMDTTIFSRFNVLNADNFNACVYMNGGDGYVGSFSKIYNSDKQPNGEEMLFKISHPTGAYIFGDYYPSDFFNKFFEEIINKTNVEYIDPVNHSLYYTLENSLDALYIYKKICREYVEKNKENYKLEMIKRKKEEIEKLENQLNKED